jgi:hypothetical protein
MSISSALTSGDGGGGGGSDCCSNRTLSPIDRVKDSKIVAALAFPRVHAHCSAFRLYLSLPLAIDIVQSFKHLQRVAALASAWLCSVGCRECSTYRFEIGQPGIRCRCDAPKQWRAICDVAYDRVLFDLYKELVIRIATKQHRKAVQCIIVTSCCQLVVVPDNTPDGTCVLLHEMAFSLDGLGSQLFDAHSMHWQSVAPEPLVGY